MYCQNRMVHTVQEGDSLYRLARQYHTTVTELILGNPGVNPYNLQVGMKLYVCPGESYVPPQGGSANTGNTGNSGSTGNTGNAGNGGNTSNAGVGGNIGIGVVIPGGQRPGGNQTAGERQNSVNQLFETMRLAWLELIYWTRMYMMSVDSGADAKSSMQWKDACWKLQMQSRMFCRAAAGSCHKTAAQSARGTCGDDGADHPHVKIRG